MGPELSIRKDTFIELCEELISAPEQQRTRMRESLMVQQCAAVTPDCYRLPSNQFGVGKSVAGAVVIEVFKAVNAALLPRLVKIENSPEIIAGFEWMGFPTCSGVIDGMHIPILCLPFQVSEYINRKG